MSQVKISELNNAALPLNPTSAFEIALGGSSFQASLQDILDLTSDGTLENLEINVDKDWENFSITNMNILETKTLQIKAVVDSVPIFESTFTQSSIEAAQILRMDFQGQNDQSTGTPYAQILVNQDDLSNGAEKGSIDFRVATGAAEPTSMLKLDGVGDGTNPQIQASADLVMSGTNAIVFPDANWKILDTSPSQSILLFETTGGQSGTIQFEDNDFIFQLQLTSEIGFLVEEKVSGGAISSRPGFQIETQILDGNDIDDLPIMIFEMNKEGTSDISNRPLFQIQNRDTAEWLLDNDGTVTQFGDLDLNGNELLNTVTTSTVTGVSGITGLGTQTIDLEMDDQTITFLEWEISNKVATTLLFEKQASGNIEFDVPDSNLEFTLGEIIAVKYTQTGTPDPDLTFVLTEISILPDSDDNTSVIPISVLNFETTDSNPIEFRKLLEIRNDDDARWTLNFDGTVTQTGNLDMGNNDITNVNTLSNLTTLTVTGTATVGFLQIDPPTDAAVPTITTTFTEVSAGTPPTEIFTMIFKGQDNVPSEETYVIIDVQQETLTENLIQGSIDFSVASATVSKELVSLLKLDGKNPQSTELDPKFGRLIAGADLQMGLFELQFDDEDHYIHQHETNLEAHVGLNQQFRIVIADPASGFTYQFGGTNSNWGDRGMTNMAPLSFSSVDVEPALNISIQRGNNARDGGNNQSLELDANEGGEIVLRVNNDEKYNFGATIANFNNNQIANAVLLSTVTGDTGITGLGILSEIVFVGTDNTIFPKDSNTNLRINANTDLECEVGNGGALVISNRSGADLFSFSSDRADFLGSDLSDLGILSYQSEITELVTNVLTPDKTFTIISAQTGISDDLTTINTFGAIAGQTLLIKPDTGDTITVNDTDNITLINASDFIMNETRNYMGLIFDGTSWIELFRNEEYVTSIVGDPSKGMSAVTVEGVTSLTITEDLILGQTGEAPFSGDDFLFVKGTTLHNSRFGSLILSLMAGNALDDQINSGVKKFYAFYGVLTGNTNRERREFPMPGRMKLRKLHINIKNNSRTAETIFALSVNGVADDDVRINLPGGSDDGVFSTDGAVDVPEDALVCLIVDTDFFGGSGNITLLDFSLEVQQRISN